MSTPSEWDGSYGGSGLVEQLLLKNVLKLTHLMLQGNGQYYICTCIQLVDTEDLVNQNQDLGAEQRILSCAGKACQLPCSCAARYPSRET